MLFLTSFSCDPVIYPRLCHRRAAQVQYVDAGWLGKKVYKGVYTYAKPLD